MYAIKIIYNFAEIINKYITDMKKFFLTTIGLLVALIISTSAVNAQCAFRQGDLGLNFGLGLGNGDKWYNNNHYQSIFVPTFNFALDYGIIGNVINKNGSVSAGGYFGIGRGSNDHGSYKYIDNRWRFGTRGALHYTWVNNLDTYAGINVGFRHDKFKGKDKSSNTTWDPVDYNDFNFFPFAGVRLMFGTFGIYSELTYEDFAYFQIGITFIL